MTTDEQIFGAAAHMPSTVGMFAHDVGTCPECGAMWDYEHERCTGNCQNADRGNE